MGIDAIQMPFKWWLMANWRLRYYRMQWVKEALSMLVKNAIENQPGSSELIDFVLVTRIMWQISTKMRRRL